MTNPDSTYAGGVTHGEAREALRSLRMNLGGETIGTERLFRYIAQQEATAEPATPPAPLPGGHGQAVADDSATVIGTLQRWRTACASDPADDETRDRAFRFVAAAMQLEGGYDERHTRERGVAYYDAAISLARSHRLEQAGEGRGG